LILGSFKDYYIVDRIGMTLQYEPLVKSTSTGRPTGEAGWFAHWRVGADCVNANAFRMLRL
jgi:predicted phage gp36 major capsid-like protein